MRGSGRLLSLVCVVGLSMTIGGTASAWSTAKGSYATFKQGSKSYWAKGSTLSKKSWSLPKFKYASSSSWKPASYVKTPKVKTASKGSWASNGYWKPVWATPAVKKIKKKLYGTKYDQPPMKKKKPMKPVPEPAAALVFGAGLLLVGRELRRRA